MTGFEDVPFPELADCACYRWPCEHNPRRPTRAVLMRYEDAAELAARLGWSLTHRIEAHMFEPRWRVVWIVEEAGPLKAVRVRSGEQLRGELCRHCGGEGWDDDAFLCPYCHGSGDGVPAAAPAGDPT